MSHFGLRPETLDGEAVVEIGAEVVHHCNWEQDIEPELQDIRIKTISYRDLR